jgi:formate dehydrogenase maturation protein FdhE
MTFAQTGGPDYDARMRRAHHLSEVHSFAAEVLTFYRQLAAFQKRLYAQIPEALGSQPVTQPGPPLRGELDLAVLVPHVPDLLSLLESIAPAPTAEAARQLALQGPAAWIAFLSDFWTFGGLPGHSTAAHQEDSAEPLTEFILRAFLQPYAEFLSAHMPAPDVQSTPRVCPRCSSLPLLGVLRPEGDGGKRSLVCSFCLYEWDFRRIFCPACGEEAETKLPVYIAEQFPQVRVEVCDTCKFYLRTIDLTKDGHAVPIVDDLAAIPLSLWAHEHGYSRLQPNLLGT